MTDYNNNLLAQDCEEWFSLSLYEVTCSVGVDADMILEIINEGIVSVHKDAQNNLQFDGDALKRIRTVIRLQHDLGINLPGAGLALELLDEIDNLKKELFIKHNL